MEHTNTTLLLLLLIGVVSISLIPSSLSQQPPSAAARRGRWKLLQRSIGISAMHVQLLPNDKLIAFDRTDAGPSNISLPLSKCSNTSTRCTAHSVEFDPSTRSLRPLSITTSTWCSSGSLSPNGTLIQTGGYSSGDRSVRLLSPFPPNSDWLDIPLSLSVRRWYSTNHILPDGRIIVVGGRAQFNYEFIPKTTGSPAIYDLPFLRETRDHSENNLYPFVHLSTDGNLFIFANTNSILLKYTTGAVLRRFPQIPGGVARNYPSSGSSVLLPLLLNSGGGGGNVRAEVMVCGGADPSSFAKAANGTFAPASSSCGRLVITDRSPVWVMEDMPMGRVMGDMVLLPTGDVLIVNGAGKGTAGWRNAREPVLSPVVYAPEHRVFEVMQSTTIPRMYHSTAHLLSDGRVTIGGSNTNVNYVFEGVLFPTELSLEVFSPPYVGVSRPNISAIDSGVEIGYGERVSVSFGVAGMKSDEAVSVVMVAPSFTTHSFSMNQRALVLKVCGVVRGGVGGKYRVEGLAPASAVLAPPGYYMLFVVHGGVPSRGKWVHVGGK